MRKVAYNRNILLLLASVFINAVGMGIMQLYSLIYVYSITGSNFYAALDGAIVFGSGTIASYFYIRYKKDDNLTLYMLICELVCFFAILIIAYAQTLFLVYVSLMIVCFSYGFYKPSYQAMLYHVAHPNDVVRINNTSSILFNVALALGWIFAPLCFDTVGYGGLFFFVAITHLVSYCLISVVKITSNKQILPDGELVEWSECGQLSFFNMMLLMASIAVIRSAIEALEMGIFKKFYYLPDMLIGVFFTIWIFGGIAAGLVNKFFNRNLSKNIWFLRLSAVIFIFASLIFSFFKNSYAGACVYFIFGFSYYFFDVISNNCIYQNATKEEHAYNFAVKNLVLNGVMLIFIPALGYIADIVSISAAMLVAVVVSFLLVILEMERHKALGKVRKS